MRTFLLLALADPTPLPDLAALPELAPEHAPVPIEVLAPAPTPAPPADDSPPWQPLAASALGVLALAIRRLQLLRWLPDAIEDAATIGVLAALGSAIPLLEVGSFSWPASLYTALAAGLSAALALWLPPPKAARALVLLLGLSLTACGTTGINAARGTFATLREAERAYRAWAEVELPRLAQQAKTECGSLLEGRAACVDKIAGRTFNAVDVTNRSLLTYHQAQRASASCLASGGALDTCTGEALRTAAVAVEQLRPLGFLVGGGR